MRIQSSIILALFGVATFIACAAERNNSPAFADSGDRKVTTAPTDDDQPHNDWMEARYKEATSIHRGDHYSDIAKYFQEDGGLTSPPHHRFVLTRCRYIKIDVELETSTKEHPFPIPPDTKVVSVSRPYFERAYYD